MVGTSGLVLACGGEGRAFRTTSSAVGIIAQEPGFELTPCTGEYPMPLFVEGLAPAEAVDRLELRLGSHVQQARGSACSEVLDEAMCLAALEGQAEEPQMVLGQPGQLISRYHLRATRGEEAFRVGTLAELLAFLGTIDTRSEAELMAASLGFQLVCGESGTVPASPGFNVLGFTYQGCDGRSRHLLHLEPSGQLSLLDSFVELEPDPNCVVGRRPEGFGSSARRSSLGQFFAGCAELEAASVPAFVRLGRELVAHGAPRALVRRARLAAAEEVRHAQIVGALARRFGVTPRWPRVPVGCVRPLEHVARENAMEGCVRETYGALVARYQAVHAREAVIRNVYGRIAVDEARHAGLSWDVARWADRRLSRAERRRGRCCAPHGGRPARSRDHELECDAHG